MKNYMQGNFMCEKNRNVCMCICMENFWTNSRNCEQVLFLGVGNKDSFFSFLDIYCVASFFARVVVVVILGSVFLFIRVLFYSEFDGKFYLGFMFLMVDWSLGRIILVLGLLGYSSFDFGSNRIAVFVFVCLLSSLILG